MDLVTVLLPRGQTVMVHKGWQPRKKSNSKSPANADTKARSPPPRCSKPLALETSGNGSPPQKQNKCHYEFINSRNPGRKSDAELLKVVRRHVRKKFIRDARQKMPGAGEKTRARSLQLNSQLPVSVFDAYLIAPSTSVSEYPIDMQPHTHSLLSKYLTYASSRMFPIGSSLRTSPIKTPEWFYFAITDAAMFHAMLYAAAIHLALLEGRPESRDTLYHQSQTITILQKRLGHSNQRVDDSTLGAISCLAIGGAISGNINTWHIHMKGLKQMIHLRGNFSSLSPLLQAKLRRSDVTGAIDYGLTPYLSLPPSPTPPTWSILPSPTISQTSSQMTFLLAPHKIHSYLLQTLNSLSLFTQALSLSRSSLNVTLSPEAFSNDLYMLEHYLLSFPSTLPSPDHEAAIERALRFSALVYLKAVLQEFPHSANGSRILVERAREAVGLVGAGYGEMDGLVAWVCVVCAAVSNDEARSWFVGELARMGRHCDQKEEAGLNKLLSLRSGFGEACIERIWEEVWMKSRAMDAEDCFQLSTTGLGFFF